MQLMEKTCLDPRYGNKIALLWTDIDAEVISFAAI